MPIWRKMRLLSRAPTKPTLKGSCMKKFLFVLAVISIMPNAARAIWFWSNNNDTAAKIRSVKVAGNRHSQSFYAVKKEMLRDVYYDHRRTLYCDAEFTAHKQIMPPE